ncbi:protein germ cell-less [Schistocerca nitens]|uniref:protein germ cell-less n=1 Tax=Schistocerca nitens TaxID=7011 RepID=UPI002119A234|nr:protein germ cell-less [Schistocerca nitens]XP_049807343.1 protein germ cell-less [Schistocerca nitens]XP_049807351.1 protein germ cell-less [Schistocerca nitens]
MGSTFAKLLRDNCRPDILADNVRQLVGKKRKRSEEPEPELNDRMRAPKKKKLMCTPKYIHKALFTEGKGSDVTVNALDKQWKLHKIYLSQSPYFASMFSGAWREADEDTVNIKIVDPKITVSALQTVFGSLYMDETTLEPSDIVSVVAAATLFQLEGIIEKCGEVMLETMCAQTAVVYYEAACEYGLNVVKENAFKFILISLLSRLNEFPVQIKAISEELMTKLVRSIDLFVISSELSLYLFLRKWLYLRLNIPPDPNVPEGVSQPCHYFQNIRKGLLPFLLTEEGKKYVETFQSLRLQHIITHYADLGILANDNIIPQNWLTPFYRIQWSNVLRINQGLDKGPEEMNNQEFWGSCMRLGRVVPEPNSMWRWMDFNNGLDLVWSCDALSVKVKRSHETDSTFLLSQAPRRHFMVRVRVAHYGNNGQHPTIVTQSSGIKNIALFKNEEVVIMCLSKKLNFPLMVSVNMISVKPSHVILPNTMENKSIQCPDMISDDAALDQDVVENLMSESLEHIYTSSCITSRGDGM